MKLSQAKYKEGFLFISKIIHENELIAIDVRYFRSIENEWLCVLVKSNRTFFLENFHS